MEEGQLVKWLKSEGDTIAEGDVLAEIETDKATMELVARGSGVLQNVTLKEGGTAPVGEVIAVIAAEGEAAEPAESRAAAPAKAAPTEDESASEGKADAESAQSTATKESKTQPAKAKVTATDDDSDDATSEDEEQEDPSQEETAKPSAKDPAPVRAAAAESGNGREGRVKASPLARRLAEEAGVELSAVEGTGPGGRITKRDIAAAAEGGTGKTQEAAVSDDAAGEDTAAAAGAGRTAGSVAAPARGGPDSEEVPVTQMRKTIAKRLAQSIGPIPTFYLTIECDMTRMTELRERTNRVLEKDGIKASINDFIIKAVAVALARHPEVNASWGDKVIALLPPALVVVLMQKWFVKGLVDTEK
jgi:pyruvate dehydrogenase E2 component (dihydrolipoamide acetyltransferase)